MINELIELNRPQQLSVLSKAKSEVNIHGRGTGKSYIIGWEMNRMHSAYYIFQFLKIADYLDFLRFPVYRQKFLETLYGMIRQPV